MADTLLRLMQDRMHHPRRLRGRLHPIQALPSVPQAIPHCLRQQVLLCQAPQPKHVVQNLAPQRETLPYIRVLLFVVVAKSRAALPTADGEGTPSIGRVGGMEVRGKVGEHGLAGVTVHAKEGVVVAYAVETLAHVFGTEWAVGVARGEGFDGAFFGADILLDVPPRTACGIYFAGGWCA